MAQASGVAEARVPDAVMLDSFDVYCPIASLPGLLGVTLDNLPAEVPYLSVPSYVSVPHLVGKARKKVGVCWSTHAIEHQAGEGPLGWEVLSPLFDLPGCEFFALQKTVAGDAAAWLDRHGVVNLGPELTDAARMAAIVHQMDLVIAPDSLVAHLAGALGKPVWVLLDTQEDWTWLLERTDSPWYPTARLFRWPGDAGWPETITNVARALTEILA
jgi:hypothetical protein